jgi:CTP:molybdopterin cytidylyltransferase MocA
VIAEVIPAAGEGRRFRDGPKLLAEFRGRPLLEHAVAAQCAVPQLERIAVVLGSDADKILERFDLMRASPVIAADWNSGQSASLRAGLRCALDGWGAEKAIVTLGDQPLLTPALIARFVREQYRGLRGVGGDRGARDLLHGGAVIECRELGSVIDVDTVEDLEAVQADFITPAGE